MPGGGDGPRDRCGAWRGLRLARAGSGGPGGDLRPLMAIQARRIPRTIPGRWLRLLPPTLFIFVTLGPLLAVLVDLVPHPFPTPEWLGLAAPQGRRLTLLAPSHAPAGAGSAVAMTLGNPP